MEPLPMGMVPCAFMPSWGQCLQRPSAGGGWSPKPSGRPAGCHLCLSLAPFKLKQEKQQALRREDVKQPPGTEKLAVHRIRNPAPNCKAANRRASNWEGASEHGPGLAVTSSLPAEAAGLRAAHRCWWWGVCTLPWQANTASGKHLIFPLLPRRINNQRERGSCILLHLEMSYH